MKLRLRCEYTRFPHMGDHSGYSQFVRFLDTDRFCVALHGAPDNDEDIPRWLHPAKPLLKVAIKSERQPWYKLSDFNAELRAVPASLASQIDVVHFLDGEHSARFLPRFIKASRISRTKTVATFHQPPAIAAEVVDTRTLRWLDRIVLVSPSQLPFFRQYVPEERLKVILHGVDSDFFHPSGIINKGNQIRCLTVGHWLRDWTMFAQVARALAHESQISFDIVTTRDIGATDLPNVRQHRAIDDSTLALLYRSTDVLFLPLTDATANNALLEGMASGLPVVASDLEAVRAYLPQSNALLVADHDVGGYVGALTRLQNDDTLRLDLGRRARARAEAISWPLVARSLEEVYSTLFSSKEHLRVR
jgi:glycosyltransferase involved in cell wall biosynthesis